MSIGLRWVILSKDASIKYNKRANIHHISSPRAIILQSIFANQFSFSINTITFKSSLEDIAICKVQRGLKEMEVLLSCFEKRKVEDAFPRSSLETTKSECYQYSYKVHIVFHALARTQWSVPFKTSAMVALTLTAKLFVAKREERKKLKGNLSISKARNNNAKTIHNDSWQTIFGSQIHIDRKY